MNHQPVSQHPKILDHERTHTTRTAAVLLAIDTCGPTGSVALGRIASGPAGKINILATAELAPKTYSAQLLPAIEEVLREARIALAALSAIIVVNGPGSFTGVRVGVSAAKGLAEGANLPIIAISSLELLARQGPGDTCAALDAGRGDFYFGLYRDGTLETEALFTLAELLEAARSSGLRIVVCEEKLAAQLRGQTPHLIEITAPTAADALSAALHRILSGDSADVATLDGNYLRRPDAENAAIQATAPTAR